MYIRHGSQRKRTYQWVAVIAIFEKGRHRMSNHVWLASGVINEKQINHLFDLQYGYTHAIDDVGKQWRHIIAHRHIGNDLFEDSLLANMALVLFVTNQL